MRGNRCMVQGALGLLLLGACAEGSRDGAGLVVLDTIGDTIVARSEGAGVWGPAEAGVTRELWIGELEGADEYTFGSIRGVAVGEDGTVYVLDGQVPIVRRYSPDGQHIASFGRSGSGPGELKQVDALAVLPDGRVLVRDPGNARINVYDATGSPVATWQIPGGSFFSESIHASAADVYTPVLAQRRPDGGWRTGLLHLRDGVVQDTVLPPYQEFTPQVLKAERVTKSGASRSSSVLPFTPIAYSTWSPQGMFVGGISSRYAIDTFRPDGKVFRVERDFTPVAVQPGERAAKVEAITRSMRNVDSNWRWSGPQPPDRKPPFQYIRVARDGRIWVQLHTEARRLPPDPDARPDPGGLPPLEIWTEPLVCDVFEADGRYLGRVRLPDRFLPHVVRGDQVWGVERDELGVEYVARYRVTLAPGADAAGN